MARPLRNKPDTKAIKATISKPNDLENKITELVALVNDSLLTKNNILKFLSAFGVGNQDTRGLYYTCHKCGRILAKEDFYKSTEIGCNSEITAICKECANELAQPTVDGERTPPTQDSVIVALEQLRKPFLDKVWDASLLEAANTASGKAKNNVWTSYIKNIQMQNYYGLTYNDSDFFTGGQYSIENSVGISRDQEIMEAFDKNKSDTLRLLGYLPFEKEKPMDQPFLYAQLIGFLDSSDEGNEDMMRVSSIISIVRGFLQINQIDDMIASLSQDIRNAGKNVSTIRALNATKKNISDTITSLAKESCISLKNTKQAKKGENTWTGKIKKIKEVNLREGEINGFDLQTCKGMMQVMEMSDASIMKQLQLDESEWSDMVSEQRILIRDLQNKLDFYSEAARIILRENIDLRDTLNSHNLLNESDLTDLEELYSPLLADYQNDSEPSTFEEPSPDSDESSFDDETIDEEGAVDE